MFDHTSKIYRVKVHDDDVIAPEETLVDSLSNHASIEQPIGQRIFGAAFVLVALGVVFILIKAFQLQVVNGVAYKVQLQQASNTTYPISSLRGIVTDRTGRALVENIPILEAVVLRGELPKDQAVFDQMLFRLATAIDMPLDDVRSIFEKNKRNGIFVVKKGLQKDVAIALRATPLPGIYIVANAQRRYIFGASLAHVLGYTTKVTVDDLQKDSYYQISDRIGRAGIEAYYEAELRGEHRAFNFNTTAIDTATVGHTMQLTIDAEIQSHLYQTLTNVLAQAGVKRGAAIVQDVRTGAVLGMVSAPSYNPNIFENYFAPNYVESVSALFDDRNHPLFNRIVSGLYSPGSTIKPLLALAGLKEGIVTAKTLVNATGALTVRSENDPSVTYTFHDWKVHGLTDIRKAIADSVDIYFYMLGGGYGDIRGLGVDRIAAYFKMFLAERTLGIDVPGEVNGFIPTKDWKKQTKGEAWYVGDTYNISIGQGDMNVTPLWLNSYVSAIANGGTIWRPYIMAQETTPAGDIVVETKPEVLTTVDFEPRILDIVRDGMRRTITNGTAPMLKDIPVSLAAKTGTAQISSGKALNSLFVVYGPTDKPEIAMTVLVENINQSQSLAVQVAHDFMMWYFGQHTSSSRQP